MKERLTHNLGLKILSVVLAAFAWLLIMNVADPVITQTFSNIPVQIMNEDVITSRGYQYTIESGEKADIKVKGKRSVVDTLTEDDFTASADLNSMDSMYMVDIAVACSSEHSQELVISLRNGKMAIKLEDQGTQPFGIRIVQLGRVKEGFYCYESKAGTSLIQVTGSESQLETVKEIVAIVDVEGKSETFTADCQLEAYDYEGNQIDSQKLSLSKDTVPVTIGICRTQTVDITVKASDKPADGYYIERLEYAPRSVLIAAGDSLLRTLSGIEVPCSVAGATGTVEIQVDLEEFLNEQYGGSCYLADENANIAIVATISPVAEKTFEINERDITPQNLSEGLECMIYSVGSSSVTVKGPKSELDKLKREDLHLYIDLTGCIAGTYSRQVKSGLDASYEIEAGDVMVKLAEIGTQTE